MADQSRREVLLAAIQHHDRPVSTEFAVRLLDGTEWATGRNTVRKQLRGLARAGLLAPVDTDQGRVYHPIHPESGPHVSQQPVRPMPDHERVLGQIARGEVDASAAAARRIAARHMAAYGNAVWGPAPTAEVVVLPQPSTVRKDAA